MDPLERHYSVQELAKLWNLSEDTIRRLFVDEPGVFNLSKPSKWKRTYRPIRIPESVARRVYERMTNGVGR